MRQLAGLLLVAGALAAVGCRSNPCEPSLWDRLWGRQPAMMMGDPCGCPCNKPMGMDMEMAYDGPIFAAPPGLMSGPAPPGGVRGDVTSGPPRPLQDKGFAQPRPYVPEKDGK